MRFWQLLVEVLGWLKFIASPFLMSALLALVIYLKWPDIPMYWIYLLLTLGLNIGIAVAILVYRKKGSIHFFKEFTEDEPDV